jgi:serine protease AprX
MAAARQDKQSGTRKRAKRDDGGQQFPLREADDRISVLVEMAGGAGASPVAMSGAARGIDLAGFDSDEEFVPVPLQPGGVPAAFGMAAAEPTTYVVRGRVRSEEDMAALRARPEVVDVWVDTPIAPFPGIAEVQESPAAGTCPIPPCDCSPSTPRGNIADVATYLGVSQVWAEGYRGTGMVVGVVDGGITAQGRPVKAGETSRRIPRVIGGWPVADWGTEASRWGEHGNMCSTDVLGMAPEAQIYDLRIAGAADIPATISRALQAFQWAIDRHRVDGTPHVLSNSWGIFQESWDATYARNPNHPFTRKVVEAIAEGILVLFAAGNCGGSCPDGRCGPDNGPGRSIWGANSHPLVMTVGAVNKDEQFVGYSSQGPGALDANKPDFCCVTHFTGYFNSDSGTSASTPVLAGAVALLKQAVPSATQAGIKAALRATAKDIGPAGFDQHSGAGITRVKLALDRLRPIVQVSRAIACDVPSRTVPCSLVSRTIPCGSPSRLSPCLPSRATPCGPSVMTPCIPESRVCPTRVCPSVATPCQSQVCPTLACPSAVCRPGPGGFAGEDVGEEWYADGGYDPAGEWYSS